MKTTIKFIKMNDSIDEQVAFLFKLLGHDVPKPVNGSGYKLHLFTPHRGLNCLDEYEGWYLFEEDQNGNTTGETLHFARYADAVQYARDLYDNGLHLVRNYWI